MPVHGRTNDRTPPVSKGAANVVRAWISEETVRRVLPLLEVG